MPKLSSIRTARRASAEPKGPIHPSAWKGVLTSSPKLSSPKCMRAGSLQERSPPSCWSPFRRLWSGVESQNALG